MNEGKRPGVGAGRTFEGMVTKCGGRLCRIKSEACDGLHAGVEGGELKKDLKFAP